MKKCKKSTRFFCFKESEDCSTCNIKEIESMEQMTPKPRTVGDMIKILSQYPDDTKLIGINPRSHILSGLITVQGNCPNDKLESVMICYYDSIW